ncbi:MAG: hypothetical protein HN921_00990 [Bacteroidetes bacterium]|nr:hypothetical protein [Bacteroidota bacterium]MBT3421214.1 hypothetical protein [Bacteroidota bacterium]MBT4729780.1 hypothetical protein [Bacteroidota bacterium]MBT4970893.1 hypothetical protein [Bacteroidota bacterium]MBT7038391.1 hypothetical protein [Bacteroidota bacterium]
MISLNKLKILWLIAMLLTTVGSVSFAQQNPFYYPNTPEFEEYPLVINRKYNANITGYWEKFYGLGKLKECGELINGIRQGEWRFYRFSGSLKYSVNYINGAKTGKLYHYSIYEQVKSITRYNNNEVIYFTKYNDNTGEKEYEGPYKNGIRKGLWTIFYRSGKIAAKGYLVHYSRNGKWMFFYESGILQSEGEFVNGYKEGPWINYHKNGIIKSKGNYSRNAALGEWSYYNENGELEKVIQYIKTEGYLLH